MDLPLGSTMTNVFLADLETRLLQQTLNCSHKLCNRYIDDILAVFDEECACIVFLNLLNSQHRNVKLTMEMVHFHFWI